MQKFKLVSPFKPNGDQPQAIEKLVKGLKKGEKSQVLLGVTGSGKSLTAPMHVWVYEEKEGKFIPMLTEIGTFVDRFFSQFPQAVELRDDTEVLFLKNIGLKLAVPSIHPVGKYAQLKYIYALTRHKAPQKLYRVEAECGRSVEVTGNHNFYILRDGALQLRKTESIQKGDFIPVPFCFDAYAPSNELSYIDLTEWAHESCFFDIPASSEVPVLEFVNATFGCEKRIRMEQNCERLSNTQTSVLFKKYPQARHDAVMSSLHSPRNYPARYPVVKEFLEFLGYYIAEGHAEKSYMIIAMREKFLLERIAAVCNALDFPIGRRLSGDLQINQRLWAGIFEKMCGARSGEKHLPSFWPQLNNAQLKILLSAYFSGDGCAEKNVVTATTKSKKLASELCYALLRFDIWARIRTKVKYATNTVKKTRRKYYEVVISGQENLERFYYSVGFNLPRKQEKLWTLIGRKSNTNVDIIPLNPLLKKIRHDCDLSQKWIAVRAKIERSYISMLESNVRQPSRTTAVALINALRQSEAALQHPLFGELVSLVNSRWTSVSSVRRIDELHEYVYDFSVEGNETFLAGDGGMFVHNTYTIAEVVQQVQKPTLILSHNKTLAAQLYSEFKEFFPENAVDYFVSYYDYYQPEAYLPATDTYIEKDSSINEEINKFRHAATMHLLTRKDVIIVATVSCIYGLGSVASYEALAITLKKGQEFQRDKLLRRLTDIQYSRSQMDFKQGMFHVLGDTVEIFPPGQDTVIRLEFFGDEIDSIVEAESFTGEIVKTYDEITIFPAKHDVTTQERIKAAVENIRADMELQVAALQKMGKPLEALRLRTRTEYDLEILFETGYCTGIENYTRYLSQREPGEQPETLLDYFPDDFLLVVDESHITIPQVGGMHNGNFSRKQTLINFGFRMPSAHDNRPLKFEEFEGHMKQTIFVSATPSKYEIAAAGKNIVEQIVRPTGLIDPTVVVRPTKNQIQDLSEEIKKRMNAKERTLITTLTKRSAEDLTDYLTDAGFKVRYLHSEIDTFERVEILRDLRLGKFDVLVGINLLREGLDLPEVSFIAILDADKQGFLRSTSALIQTIGRCARNVNGFVVMYADKMTDAMKGALGETDRRRAIQVKYNEDHGITPQTIIKAIREIQVPKGKEKKKGIDVKKIPREELGRFIKGLEAQMELASANLDFERAAELRDEIEELRTKV